MRCAPRYWRFLGRPRLGWLLLDLGNAIGGLGLRMIIRYAGGEEAAFGDMGPPPGFPGRVSERIAADRVTGRLPGLPHSHNGSTP